MLAAVRLTGNGIAAGSARETIRRLEGASGAPRDVTGSGARITRVVNIIAVGVPYGCATVGEYPTWQCC